MKSLFTLIGSRDKGPAHRSLLLFFGIMEGCKILEYGTGGRNGTMSCLSPPSLLIPSVLTGQAFCFYTVKDAAEAFVFFEYFEIINRVAPCEVE
jgi:hypothetical protein